MALSTTSKLAIGGLFFGAALFLYLSSPDEGVLEYVYVDKVVDAPERYEGRDIQVHGTVGEDSLTEDVDDGEYHFVVELNGRRLRVVFDGQLPDTFMEGGEVVVTGRLEEDGSLLRSSEMSAKCPSKYEEEPGAPARS